MSAVSLLLGFLPERVRYGHSHRHSWVERIQEGERECRPWRIVVGQDAEQVDFETLYAIVVDLECGDIQCVGLEVSRCLSQCYQINSSTDNEFVSLAL